MVSKANYLHLVSIEPSDYNDTEPIISNACKNLAIMLYSHKDNHFLWTFIRRFLRKVKNQSQEELCEFVRAAGDLQTVNENILATFYNVISTIHTNKDRDHLRGFTVECFAQICYEAKHEKLLSQKVKADIYNGKAINFDKKGKLFASYIKEDSNPGKKQSVDIILLTMNSMECVEIKVEPNTFKLENIRLFEVIYNTFMDFENKPFLVFYTWGTLIELQARISDLCINHTEANKYIALKVNTDIA